MNRLIFTTLALCLLVTGQSPANDIVIRNVTLVDVVNMEIRPDQEIIVRDGKIRTLQDQPLPGSKGDKIIDGTSLVALPGFVNTHTHLWQHLAKGYYPNGNLQEWVRIYRLAHYLEEEELYQTTLAAASEALLSGITTVADFASVNFSDFSLNATARALTDSSMGGALIYWNACGFLPHQAKAEVLTALQASFPNLDLWMGHGPFSFFPVPAVYDAISLAKDLNLPMTEHTMENVREQRDFYRSLGDYLETWGAKLSPEIHTELSRIYADGPPSNVDGVEWIRRLARDILENDRNRLSPREKAQLKEWAAPPSVSPVPLLDFMGAFDGPYISIHSVWQSRRDMDIYRTKNVAVSHNPESNMYLSSGIAPILEYKRKNILVCLATDGAASNDGINFFSAMRGMWNLQKIGTLDTRVSQEMEAWYLIQAATINGAKAMQIDHRTGSLDPGKEADITLLSRKRLKLAPYVPDVNNVLPLIIYSGTPSAVETVISDGKIVVQDRKLVTGPGIARLAGALSQISSQVNERQNTGKTWAADFRLDTAILTPNWHRFRSVRKKDIMDISLTNAGKETFRLHLAFSGNPFGGNSAAVLSPRTLAVFPLAPVEKYWEKIIPLEPGQQVRVLKNKDSYDYTLRGPGETLTRTGGPEQVLFYVNHE